MVRWKSKNMGAMGIVIDSKGNTGMVSKDVRIEEDQNAGLDLINRRIFIPGEVPSLKNSKVLYLKNKNTKDGGTRKIPAITSSNFVKKYKAESCWYYKLFAQNFRAMLKDKPKPYIIEFQFVREYHDIWDFANMVQMPQDMMVDFKWIEDDNVNVILPMPNVVEPYLINPLRPGVWIKVL